MKTILLAGILLMGVTGFASAAEFTISIGDEPRWSEYRHHHHHKKYKRCYRGYDCPRDYYGPTRYYYRGGYFRHGVWVPRERVVVYR